MSKNKCNVKSCEVLMTTCYCPFKYDIGNHKMYLRYFDIIKDYKRHHRKSFSLYASLYRKEYKNNNDIKSLIKIAAKSLCPVNKNILHCHQYHAGRSKLVKYSKSLTCIAPVIENIKRKLSFKVLYELCCSKKIEGIGDLTAYDTALRIGFGLGIMPRDVYLHAAPLEAVRKLVSCGSNVISLSCLPSSFHKLSHAEAENCLCIYKDAIIGVAKSKEKARIAKSKKKNIPSKIKANRR